MDLANNKEKMYLFAYTNCEIEPTHPPQKKKKIISSVFPLFLKIFLGMKTPVVGEPSADGGFQSAFPCMLQVKYHWPQFLKDYSLSKIMPLCYKCLFHPFFSSSALICGFTGCAVGQLFLGRFIKPTTTCTLTQKAL